MFKLKIYTFYILLTFNLNRSFGAPKPESNLQQRWKENLESNENWKKMDKIEEEHVISNYDLNHIIPFSLAALSSILETQKNITNNLEVSLENDKVQQKDMQDIKTTLSKVAVSQAYIAKSLKTGWNLLKRFMDQARSAQMQPKMSFVPPTFWDDLPPPPY